jgi:cation diffusion facilitator family transporter
MMAAHNHSMHDRSIPRDNRSQVQKILLQTLVLNLFVLGIKLVVGLATGSLSLIADALHSLTDSANNILGLWANRAASPQPDREHPYGHQKFEAVGALGIAGFLSIACFEILKGAIDRILNPAAATRITGSEFWFLLLVLAVNIFVATYERREGKRLKSNLLIADAHHTLSDIWVTIAVLIGLAGVWILKWQWLDIALSFPVAALVMWSGWTVLRENLPWLVDESAIAPEHIAEIARSVPGVLNVHNIASRGIIGRQCFIEMHLVVEPEEVTAAHNITEAIETELENRFSPVRIMIHVEPPSYRSEQLSY